LPPHPVLLGGLIGGILYSRFSTLPTFSPSPKAAKEIERPTIDQTFNIDPTRALAIYEALRLGIVAAVGFLAPKRDVLIPGVVGGLLIGGSQFTSLWLTLGVSTANEQLGDLF